MAPVIHVKADDPEVGKQREAEAKRVLNQFGHAFSDCRILCFFDDVDCREFKLMHGETNRAFHRVITDKTAFAGWPAYITDVIFVFDLDSIWNRRIFDHVVYLYGSTCANTVGMVMSFAHELQHIIQHTTEPDLLRANNLFRHLPKPVVEKAGLEWSDIPTEREARVVGKKVAVELLGSEAVQKYLVQRASGVSDKIELADVQFIQTVDTSVPYILRDETLALFERFKDHRSEFEAIVEEFTASDPDFVSVDLDVFFPPEIVSSN